MSHCQIVEVQNLADADGYACTKSASTRCSDCGVAICEAHTETCDICGDVFCPSCLSFHQAEASHPKPATAERERRERKSAWYQPPANFIDLPDEAA